MRYLPSNTLNHYLTAPQTKIYDLSEVPVSVIASATFKYRHAPDQNLANPNNSALDFYALNHCAAIVKRMFTRNEPLPPWAEEVMKLYTACVAEQGLRMLHYIMSITTREMRHWATYSKMQGTNKASDKKEWDIVATKAGDAMVDFIQSLKGYDEDEAVDRYMLHPPKASLKQYLTGMSVVFHKGGWTGQFGGKKWGIVTDAALRMVTGETSMEMLVDTGYTLAHNGGPIFNKGMLYMHYDATSLYTILDTQASGQIPSLVLDPNSYGVNKTPLATSVVTQVQKALPQEFKPLVDWDLVMANPHCKGNYHHYKSLQNPEPVKPVKKTTKTASKKVSTPPPPKPTTLVVEGKTVQITGEWKVAPGLAVPIFTRKAA